METNNQIGNNLTVLMVCPSFPPQADVGGLRPAMFSKYLPLFGWQPAVLTRTYPFRDLLFQPSMEIDGLPNGRDTIAVEWGGENEKKELCGTRMSEKIRHFFKPDFSQPPGLLREMLSKATKRLSNRKFDAIWATSPHLSCLTVGAQLSKQMNIPWVADFRDIFEQDNATSIREKLLDFRLLYRRRQITKTASAVVTVSEHHAKILASRLKKEVGVIYNGFDPDLFRPASHHQSDKFTIVYMGRILSEWLRNPKPLFGAIDALITSSDIDPDDIEIIFYGTEPDLLKELAESFKCKELIRCLPRVRFKDVPLILQESCVNLILTNIGRLGILTTKAFEYLAVKRPILCLPGDGGELESLIRDNNAGFTCQTVSETVDVIKGLYSEWKSTGTIRCQSDVDKIAKFSRVQQAEQLADILNSIR